MIFVRVLTKRLRDKLVPRNSAHRIKAADVTNATLYKLRPDHSFALQLQRIGLEREGHRETRRDGRSRPSRPAQVVRQKLTSIRPDDPPNLACSGRFLPRFLFLRLDHIEILVSRACIK